MSVPIWIAVSGIGMRGRSVWTLHVMLLEARNDAIAGKIYNAGYENHTIARLARIVRDAVEAVLPGRAPVEIVTMPTADCRSYHISSEKIKRELGFAPRHTIEDAVRDVVVAFRAGKVPNALGDVCYYNIRTMQTVKLA